MVQWKEEEAQKHFSGSISSNSPDYNLQGKKAFQVNCLQGTFKTSRFLKIVIGIGNQNSEKNPAIIIQFAHSERKNTGGILILFLNSLVAISQIFTTVRELGDWCESV